VCHYLVTRSIANRMRGIPLEAKLELGYFSRGVETSRPSLGLCLPLGASGRGVYMSRFSEEREHALIIDKGSERIQLGMIDKE